MATDPDCIFCKIVAGAIPCFNVYEDDDTLAFMDINPVNEGHALIVPKVHSEDVFAVSDAAIAATSMAAKSVAKAVWYCFLPENRILVLCLRFSHHGKECVMKRLAHVKWSRWALPVLGICGWFFFALGEGAEARSSRLPLGAPLARQALAFNPFTLKISPARIDRKGFFRLRNGRRQHLGARALNIPRRLPRALNKPRLPRALLLPRRPPSRSPFKP